MVKSEDRSPKSEVRRLSKVVTNPAKPDLNLALDEHREETSQSGTRTLNLEL